MRRHNSLSHAHNRKVNGIGRVRSVIRSRFPCVSVFNTRRTSKLVIESMTQLGFFSSDGIIGSSLCKQASTRSALMCTFIGLIIIGAEESVVKVYNLG